MDAVLTILASIAVSVGICTLSAFVVTACMVRPYFTRRRWLMVRAGKAECVGGPFDGCDLPVSRAAALAWALMAWPNVFYDAYTKTYHLCDENEHRRRAPGNFAATWAGYYRLAYGGDRFTWESTDLAKSADHWLAEMRRNA